jgi:hypothetical protein
LEVEAPAGASIGGLIQILGGIEHRALLARVAAHARYPGGPGRSVLQETTRAQTAVVLDANCNGLPLLAAACVLIKDINRAHRNMTFGEYLKEVRRAGE